MLTNCSSQLQLVPGFLHPPPIATSCYLSSYNSVLRPTVKHQIGNKKTTNTYRCRCRFTHGAKAVLQSSSSEEKFQVLAAIRSCYNHILILDTPNSRLLLLDPTHNVHSMLNKGSKWTGSYWDEFATFPPVVPRGPIAIFGLGGGTAAHLMLELWPSLQLEGWEIDEILIDKARDYLGLCDLEKHNKDGGALNIHIGDVFSPSVNIPGGYAGIIVDLFADGKVLPQLEEAATWLEFYDKLMPNGRLMVNCGAGKNVLPGAGLAVSQNDGSLSDGAWELNATLKALCKAFPGQVNWKKMPKRAGENYLALTGPLPDLAFWSAALPSELSSSIYQWKICNIHNILSAQQQISVNTSKPTSYSS